MSSRGSAFLALWNGFDPALLDEYECWHTFEHVPERLSVPGFLTARRYAAGHGADRRFLTLYEIEALEVLDTPAYQLLVDQPTAWSVEMRRSFRGFQRYPCRRIAAAGCGLSGAAATFVFSVPALSDEIDRLAAVLNAHAASGRVTAFQIGVSIGAPRYKVFQQEASATEGAVTIVAVVEATQRRLLDESGQALRDALAERFLSTSAPRWETFDLLYAIAKPELLEARSARLSPREELRTLFRER